MSVAPWRSALALSLGAALSLGVTRFSYGLLLPAMRDDLGWSYVLAGAMNTANAAGYMVGATMMPVEKFPLEPLKSTTKAFVITWIKEWWVTC